MKTDPKKEPGEVWLSIQKSPKDEDEITVEEALTIAMAHLDEVRTSTKQTANDLHQIRNLLAALLILGMIWFFAVAILELSR
jgi:hypothetical protein